MVKMIMKIMTKMMLMVMMVVVVVVAVVVVVVVCLLNVPATCECISGTDLLRQLYVLPH